MRCGYSTQSGRAVVRAASNCFIRAGGLSLLTVFSLTGVTWAQTVINPGQTLSGALTAAAPDAACFYGVQPADRYQFTLANPSAVTIDLISLAFDTTVCLLNSANQSVAYDYDSGTASNSRLSRSLSTGTYFIEVVSAVSGGGGAYTLSLQPGWAAGIPVGVPSETSATLSTTAADASCFYGGPPADRYEFSVGVTTVVTLDVTSAVFDTTVCLLNASTNASISYDYNSGPGTNARLSRSLSPGKYFIEVTTASPGNAGGIYSLALSVGYPEGALIDFGQPKDGTLLATAADSTCYYGGPPADRYKFVVVAPTVVTVDVAASAFDVDVCIIDSSNAQIAYDYDSGPSTNPRVSRSLATGTYYIEVSTETAGNAGGPYRVSLNTDYPPGWPILNGENRSATLSSTAADSNCWYGGPPTDRWAFRLRTASTVTIEARSAAFDVGLCLLDSNNDTVSYDDSSGGGTNARISRSLSSPQKYYIEVSSRSPGGAGGDYTLILNGDGVAGPPLGFHTVSPCRAIDTRDASLGGPALSGGSARTFAIAGSCDIPTTAKAISANITVTGATGNGDLRLYPGGTGLPLVSAINFAAGQTRANNAVIGLGGNGNLAVQCDQAAGTSVHFILDVNGYFETLGP